MTTDYAFEDRILALLASTVIIGLLLITGLLIFGAGSGHNTWREHCYDQGGEVARISHGKTGDDLCVRGNVVINRR